jgi:hypothetical protein
LKNTTRQRFVEGAITAIDLSDNRLIFGRLLPGFHIGIYDWVIKKDDNLPDIESILQRNIIIYVRIFKRVVTKSEFRIIGLKELTKAEQKNIPPHFQQSLGNIKKCKIYYEDGTEIDVTPQDCIGLEGPVIWDSISLISRIENHYLGKKDPYVELFKVILSEDDPRHVSPHALRWDFENQVYKRSY